GECELQDYTFQEGRPEGRYREAKRFNPVEDFGGDVIYVANRCILCTRCVRFMDDVAQHPILNVSERGDRAVIGKFEGEDMTHPWAGNVIDLCPVGALLSKDALNKARAWELDRAASVCPNCSQGCNIMIEARDNTVVRLRPRPNDDVNKYFMCDHGRLNYRWLNRRDRVDVPMVRQGATLAGCDWDRALDEAVKLMNGKRVFVLASPMLSNEALYLLSVVIERTGGAGAFRVPTGPEAPLAGVEDLALRADRAANVRGAELLGFTRRDRPLDGLGAGDVLLVADEELVGEDAAGAARAGATIVVGTTLPFWARHVRHEGTRRRRRDDGGIGMTAFGLHLLQAGVPPSQELLVAPNPDHFKAWLVATILKIVILFTIYLVGVALLTLAERKIAGWIQDRLGPNRVGPGGLLQPAADGLKNIMKEETYPGAAYKPLFIMAPALSFIPAL